MEQGSYLIMGFGERRYSFAEVAEMTADGIIGAESRISRDGANWEMMQFTPFGAMMPTLCARWAIREHAIERRFVWFFHSVMACGVLFLLSFALENLRLVFGANGILIYSAVSVIVMLILSWSSITLLGFFWSLIPHSQNRLPPVIRLALLFIPVFGMFWVFNAIYSLAVKLEKLHFKSGLRQRESGVQNALVACCIFCCSWLVGWIPLAGFILCIIAFTCFYRAMCTMKEQALDILNKRQRMDYFPFPPSGPPEVPRELRKFAYRRGRTLLAVGVIAAVALLWAGPLAFSVGRMLLTDGGRAAEWLRETFQSPQQDAEAVAGQEITL